MTKDELEEKYKSLERDYQKLLKFFDTWYPFVSALENKIADKIDEKLQNNRLD